MLIGQKIRYLRKASGLTQTELGERINKSGQVVSNWERGYTNDILSRDIEKLASALNVDASLLVTDELSTKLLGDKPFGETASVQQVYYHDPETARLAQEAHDNPDLKILFDASRKLSPKDLKTVTALVKSLAGDSDE